eukprot:2927079-Prorocentrum_lima.AAC.1
MSTAFFVKRQRGHGRQVAYGRVLTKGRSLITMIQKVGGLLLEPGEPKGPFRTVNSICMACHGTISDFRAL